MLESRSARQARRRGQRSFSMGLILDGEAGEVHAIMGPNGSGKSTLSYVLAGRDGYEVTGGDPSCSDGEDLLAMAPDERAAKGVFLAFQYPIEIPGVATMQFLKVALNAQRKARGETELSTPDFMRLVRDRARQARHLAGDAEARRSMSAFPAARRSVPRFCRWRCSSRRSASWMRPIPASTSMPCAIVADGVNALRSPRARHDRHHPLSAPARLHRAGPRACSVAGPHREVRRQDPWPSSSRSRAMPSSARTRRDEHRRPAEPPPKRPICEAGALIAANPARREAFEPFHGEGLAASTHGGLALDRSSAAACRDPFPPVLAAQTAAALAGTGVPDTPSCRIYALASCWSTAASCRSFRPCPCRARSKSAGSAAIRRHGWRCTAPRQMPADDPLSCHEHRLHRGRRPHRGRGGARIEAPIEIVSIVTGASRARSRRASCSSLGEGGIG